MNNLLAPVIITPQSVGTKYRRAIYRPELCSDLHLTDDQDKVLHNIVDFFNKHLYFLPSPIDFPPWLTPVIGILGKRLGGPTGRQIFEEGRSRGEIAIFSFNHGWLPSNKTIIMTSGHNEEGHLIAAHIRERAGSCLISVSEENLRIGAKAGNTTENFLEFAALAEGKTLDGRIIGEPLSGPLISFIATTEYHAWRIILEDILVRKASSLNPLLRLGPVVFLMSPNPYHSSSHPQVTWMVDVNESLHLVSPLQVNLFAVRDQKLDLTSISPEVIELFKRMVESINFLECDPRGRVVFIKERSKPCEGRIKQIKGSIGVVRADLFAVVEILEKLQLFNDADRTSWMSSDFGAELLKSIGLLIEYIRWRADPEAVEFEQSAPPPMENITQAVSALSESSP